MLTPDSLKKAYGVESSLSPEMASAQQVWTAIYQGRSPWLASGAPSLHLGATIASEIARAVTLEMTVTITGSARAVYLDEQFARLLERLRERVEQGSARGGIVFKPYPDGADLAIDVVQADHFVPIEYDRDGNITAAVFADRMQKGRDYYTRLEMHRMDGTSCVILNKAFRSSAKDELGSEIPLTAVEEWADLLPAATIPGVERPLFAYFRFPLANTIDPDSPLGVSCFSRAVDLIQQADEHWGRFIWEFESGERALYVDAEAFEKGPDGKPRLPHKKLYRALAMTGQVGGEELFKEWTPTLREENILRGLDAILKRIEFNCGLAYGTLSDPEWIAKTATEVKTSQQRSYATVKDTQEALERALTGLLYAMDVWANAYHLAPKGSYQVVFDWDDSVVVDKGAQMQQDLVLVQSGLMSKATFLKRNFRYDEATLKDELARIASERPTFDLFGEDGT